MYRHALLLLLPVKTDIEIATVEINFMFIVVRLHGVPFAYHSLMMAKQLCGGKGGFLNLIPPRNDNLSRYILARVNVDITKPLKRGSYLRFGDEVRRWINLMYERLTFYCYLCGLVGHLEKKCPMR